MPGAGIQHVPLRYPREMPPWLVQWLDRVLVPELAKLDVRNAIEGLGIGITGQSSEQATISASEDLGQLFDADFALAESTPLLPNARVITGEENVVQVSDGGPGGQLRIGLAEGGVGTEKLALSPRHAVIGNPTASTAAPDYIRALTDDVVLRRVAGVVEFGKVTPEMIDPPITSRYLVPIANGDADSPDVVFDDTGDLVFAEAETY